MPHPYDEQFVPPFPTLPIRLMTLERDAGTDALTAQLDTGADSTLVPASVVQAIGAEESYSATLRSHWGEHRRVTIYLVDMEVAGELLPGVEVIADQLNTDVLLGRNVLNRLILLLDGHRMLTDVLTRRPNI